jgi:hypothetical protein
VPHVWFVLWRPVSLGDSPVVVKMVVRLSRKSSAWSYPRTRRSRRFASSGVSHGARTCDLPGHNLRLIGFQEKSDFMASIPLLHQQSGNLRSLEVPSRQQ